MLGADLPQPAEGRELGRRPLARDHLAAERGAVAGRPVDPGLPLPPALEVAGVAVEHAALGGPVPLRREQQPPAGELAGPLDEMDVGFLARLHETELGVDGAVVGDDPVRPRLRAVQGAGVGPRRPAVAGGWCVRVVLLHR